MVDVASHDLVVDVLPVGVMTLIKDHHGDQVQTFDSFWVSQSRVEDGRCQYCDLYSITRMLAPIASHLSLSYNKQY